MVLPAVRQKGQILPSFALLVIHVHNGLVDAHLGEGHLLYGVHQFKGPPHPESPAQTHPEIKFKK